MWIHSKLFRSQRLLVFLVIISFFLISSSFLTSQGLENSSSNTPQRHQVPFACFPGINSDFNPAGEGGICGFLGPSILDSSGNMFLIWNDEFIRNEKVIPTSALMKYDPSGQLIWMKLLTSIRLSTIVFDNNGDIITIGISFKENFTLTGDNVRDRAGSYNNLLYGSNTDIYFAKFDSDGIIQWDGSLGGSEKEPKITEFQIDISNNIILTGRTYSSDFPLTKGKFPKDAESIDFIAKIHNTGRVMYSFVLGVNPDEPYYYKLMSKDNSNYVIAYPGRYISSFDKVTTTLWIGKLGPLGDFVWKIQREDLPEKARAVSRGIGLNLFDQENNLIVGYLSGQSYSNEVTIMKISPQGKVKWEKVYAPNNFPQWRFFIDRQNLLLIAGDASNPNILDPDASSATTLSTPRFFMQKLDPAGVPVWSKYIELSEYRGINILETDTNDNIFLRFDGQALQKFDPGGKLIWNSTVLSQNYRLYLDNNDKETIVGSSDPSRSLPTSYYGFSRPNWSNGDLFIAKLDQEGEIAHSNILGGSRSEIFQNLKFDSDNNMILIGATNSLDFPMKNAYNSKYQGSTDIPSTEFFITKISPEGEVLWSTFAGGTNGLEVSINIDSLPINLTREILTVIFGLTILSALGVGSKLIWFSGKPAYGKSLLIIKEIFQSQTTLYFVLTGQDIIEDENLKNKIEKKIPKKIFDFKYLLNPIRLSMSKLLFENLEMTSVELKEVLEISWNDYTNHIKSLETKGYVRISEDFVDGRKRQVISLESIGIRKYKQLTELLQLFLDNTVDYHDYLEDISDDILYPEK